MQGSISSKTYNISSGDGLTIACDSIEEEMISHYFKRTATLHCCYCLSSLSCQSKKIRQRRWSFFQYRSICEIRWSRWLDEIFYWIDYSIISYRSIDDKWRIHMVVLPFPGECTNENSRRNSSENSPILRWIMLREKEKQTNLYLYHEISLVNVFHQWSIHSKKRMLIDTQDEMNLFFSLLSGGFFRLQSHTPSRTINAWIIPERLNETAVRSFGSSVQCSETRTTSKLCKYGDSITESYLITKIYKRF